MEPLHLPHDDDYGDCHCYVDDDDIYLLGGGDDNDDVAGRRGGSPKQILTNASLFVCFGGCSAELILTGRVFVVFL